MKAHMSCSDLMPNSCLLYGLWVLLAILRVVNHINNYNRVVSEGTLIGNYSV